MRATVGCEVEIGEISTDQVQTRHKEWFLKQVDRGYLSVTELPHMPSQRETDDAALLQAALRADAARLDAWVLHQVATVFATKGMEVAEPPEGEREGILMPVIERPPPAQRHRFREAVAKDRLVEVVEEFFNSFRVSFRGVEYEHVGVGDTRPT